MPVTDQHLEYAAALPVWLRHRDVLRGERTQSSESCKSRAVALYGVVFPHIAIANDRTWQPGPYPGVELLVLHQNETTCGVTVLRKFSAGITVPAHLHRHANESAYVLSGEWEESGIVYSAGTFFFAPKGERHGPHVARTEVISLTIFDGPLTVD